MPTWATAPSAAIIATGPAITAIAAVGSTPACFAAGAEIAKFTG